MKARLNDGWEYRSELNGNCYEPVTLPHTPRLEPLDVGYPFQGLAYYRRRIPCTPAMEGKLVYVEFEAVMQRAEVRVNGELVTEHKGGYLPFRVDITYFANKYSQIELEVLADNRDNRDIPPGKVARLLDFNYQGGIYRNVWLSIEDRLHITDAVERNVVRGGGIFVSYSNVSEAYAEVVVRTEIENRYGESKRARVETVLADAEGVTVVQNGYATVTEAGGFTEAECKLGVRRPHLWSCDAPYRYILTVTVKDEDNRTLDTRTLRIGIRSVYATLEDGLLLNGRPVQLIGANRHQYYPHVGNAAPDNAQWRDAYKLKMGGFNFVRLAHYPQSTAFLDACDELGLLVMEPTPGWQWCKTGEFREHVLQNIRDMVRRDRNHPSVILFETSLNETGDMPETMWHESWEGCTDDFVRACRLCAEREYERGNFLTAGDTVGRRNPNSIGYDVVFTGLTANGTVDTTKNTAAELEKDGYFRVSDKPTLRREYGDFGYGMHYSTSRQSRDVSESCAMLQAWNFMHAFNKARREDYHTVGNAIWCGIDYNRGYFPGADLCTCGALDSYRLPKITYHFFESQQSDRPTVHIANRSCKPVGGKIVVFSNCDEVALLVNGHEVARQSPDRGPTTAYGAKEAKHPYLCETRPDLAAVQCDIGVAGACYNEEHLATIDRLYREDGIFDGGNCECHVHPPFTFRNISVGDGVLTAVGYTDGREVVRDSCRAAEEACELRLRIDTSGRPLAANGDFLFVYAELVDKNGTVASVSDRPITFTLEGDGELLTPSASPSVAGIATAMVRSGNRAGTLCLHAKDEQNGMTAKIQIPVCE